MTLTLTLPIPPSTNNLFRNAGKRRVRSKQYDAWVAAACLNLPPGRYAPALVPGPVSIEIAMRQPRANADIDNRIKAPLDLLVLFGVIEDDKNVRKVSAEWADVKGCRVIVRPA